jgi:hypothetical protein
MVENIDPPTFVGALIRKREKSLSKNDKMDVLKDSDLLGKCFNPGNTYIFST